jgi:hypothetical protein
VCCRAGSPDFSCCNIPKREKIYQLSTKCTRRPCNKCTIWPLSRQNGHKIYQPLPLQAG